MRLRTSDYRHPAELPTFIASVGLAITLLALAEGFMFWLLIGRPFFAPTSIALGLLLLIVFHAGVIWGIAAIPGHTEALRRAGRRAGPTRNPRVHEAAEIAAKRLSAPGTPPIYVIPFDEVDSFSVAWSGAPEIFVTEGMVQELGDLELRAALAHELAHLKGHHARLLTLVRLPLMARLAPKLLLAPFALAWIALRWWAGVVELSADRAAAIACAGPEPVVRWLSAAIGRDELDPGDVSLHRYLANGAHETIWQLAEEDLHAIAPRLAHRIVALARFATSGKFTVCLGIVGDLKLPRLGRRLDPALPGFLPHVTIGVLAGLWLTPVAIWLTLAVWTAPRHAEATTADLAPVRSFDPEMAPAPEPVAETPPGTIAGGDAIGGMLELARMHKERKEYDRALRVLQDLLEIDVSNAEAHYLLAWTWIGLNDKQSAIQEFTATVNLTEPSQEIHQDALAALERMQ